MSNLRLGPHERPAIEGAKARGERRGRFSEREPEGGDRAAERFFQNARKCFLPLFSLFSPKFKLTGFQLTKDKAELQIYEISHAPSSGARFAWASGYGALDCMPFLVGKFKERKFAFWKVNPKAGGAYIDAGATEWPDFMGCGNPPPFCFLSQRVVDSLVRLGVNFNFVTEMPLVEVKAKALRGSVPPRYFVVQANSGIEVDFPSMGVPVDNLRRPILNPLPPGWPPPFKLLRSSWNGLHFFSYSNFGEAGLNLLCTSQVKDLAEIEGWTNVSFKPVDLV